MLCPDPRQSSPLRILDLPSDPVCSMLKAKAMIGSWCGKGRSCLVCSRRDNGTALISSHAGARKGPAMRPSWLISHEFPVGVCVVLCDFLVDVLSVVGT